MLKGILKFLAKLQFLGVVQSVIKQVEETHPGAAGETKLEIVKGAVSLALEGSDAAKDGLITPDEAVSWTIAAARFFVSLFNARGIFKTTQAP